MIILNNNTNVNIPDYDDLVNKPSINGVVLEGNKTAGELGIVIDTTNFYTKREVNERIADSITSIENEFGNYYTKTQSDSKYQPKGNYLTSIPSGYATESWVENKGYLTTIPSEYVTETELQQKDFATNSDVNDEIGRLDSSLSSEIGKKQDTLVSGENIKTINGISLLGNGNIVITGSGEGGSIDLSNYYTKGEVDNLINNVEVDLTGYATEQWVENKGYLTTIPSEYVTETELTAKNFATKSEIPTIPTNISSFNNDSGYITISALTGYATETYVSNNYQLKGNYLTSIPSEYITETELTAKNYATKSEIPTIPTNISSFNNDSGYATETYVSNNYQPKGNYLTSVPSEYITETELTNKGYATTTQLNSKQDTLVSGTNIKTINGISLLGNGNIVITGSGEGESVDLSNYYTKGEVDNLIDNVEVDLTGYATETYVSNNYQPKGNYLTSIPSEYVTETELNDAIAGIGGGSDVPYVVITTQSVTSTTLEYTGDLNGVINAVKNKTPYNAYFYNKATYYGVRYALYEVDFVYYDSTNDKGNFYVHSEGGGGQHRVNSLPFTFDGENYQLGDIAYVAENYATVSQVNNKQDILVSGTNIKTINGNSILGSGDLEITTDLSNYYTKSEIDTQIGDINTILENILN